VLIDDLVTKVVDEPYRMFTSRAEYRILLRQDDADIRLTDLGYNIGLAKKERKDLLDSKKEEIERIINFTSTYSVNPEYINTALEKLGTSPLKQKIKLRDLLTRPQININNISQYIPALKEEIEKTPNRKEEITEATEIKIKYDGYIKREQLIAEKISRLENIKIKDKFDYNNILSLSTEARQKLSKINPETIAQASRIPGISPNDISILLVLLGR
jgi:tRNA uridine 5-carboxymethylaminomethyl modification enzyme